MTKISDKDIILQDIRHARDNILMYINDEGDLDCLEAALECLRDALGTGWPYLFNEEGDGVEFSDGDMEEGWSIEFEEGSSIPEVLFPDMDVFDNDGNFYNYNEDEYNDNDD